jgi:multidrug efflux system membrane fusion protein
VVEHGVVRFLPIKIVSDGPDGMWIAGVPEHVDIITVGQEFVTEGEKVKAVVDKAGEPS